MIDLNFSAAPAADDLIKDTTEATFMADVIEVSKTTPVIVDFWAPWCGPCKTLGPQLESAVRAAKGAVKMVKVNIDEAQRIAGQLQIQSIPDGLCLFQWSADRRVSGCCPAIGDQGLHRPCGEGGRRGCAG